jgi:hypothetical protein
MEEEREGTGVERPRRQIILRYPSFLELGNVLHVFNSDKAFSGVAGGACLWQSMHGSPHRVPFYPEMALK